MPTVSFNTHFPGYEILGELGRSNARVLKARHMDSGDLVAIKHFALNTDAETLRRFRLESRLMTEIRHPNVVRVREVQLEMAMPFIVMEWIEGGSLRTLLSERGHLDFSTTLRLGLQMAEAFKAIHMRGIIHRDIKPENILFRLLPSGELHFLLTDFGVARLREQTQTMTGQSLMTYEYASPEQFDNPRGVDVATDYYALGVVLYECLAGRVPFSLGDTAGIATFMNQVLRTPAPVIDQLESGQPVPPSMKSLLGWLLTKDPAHRLSDVDELVLLLGQAHVEYLQAGRSVQHRAPDLSRTMAAPAPAPRPVILEPEPEGEEVSLTQTNWLAYVAVIVVVGVLIGFAVFSMKGPKKTLSSVTPDTTLVVQDSLAQEPVAEDSVSTATDSQTDNESVSDSATSAPPVVDEEPAQTTEPPVFADSLRTRDTTRTGQ